MAAAISAAVSSSRVSIVHRSCLATIMPGSPGSLSAMQIKSCSNADHTRFGRSDRSAGTGPIGTSRSIGAAQDGNWSAVTVGT